LYHKAPPNLPEGEELGFPYPGLRWFLKSTVKFIVVIFKKLLIFLLYMYFFHKLIKIVKKQVCGVFLLPFGEAGWGFF
jgi:hypothetical protein